MRLTLVFTDSPDIATLKSDDLYSMYLELPSEVLQVQDAREQAIAIGECVGQLTEAYLHISCKELGLKRYPVETRKIQDGATRHRVYGTLSVMLLRFERICVGRYMRRDFRILAPVSMPVERNWFVREQNKLFLTSHGWVHTDEQRDYARCIDNLVETCLTLLNSEPTSERVHAWKFMGFHPYKKHAPLITLFNNRMKRRRQEAKKQEREEQKRKAREEKRAQKVIEHGISPSEPPRTGAGRRVGAVPGIFQGVMFRSQLEIRFVTQLAAKDIRWVYEGERLGDGQYLVDFYLPELKCWVEVKGRIEPRDDYLLKEVADYLKRERGERVYIYTQSKAYLVTPQQFREMSHDEFWSKL